MKNKPDLKPGDKFYIYDLDGTKIIHMCGKCEGDQIQSTDDQQYYHYRAIQGVIRKNPKQTLPSIEEFNQWWNTTIGSRGGVNQKDIIKYFGLKSESKLRPEG